MDPAVALIGSTLNATSLLSPRAAGRAAFEIFLRPGRMAAGSAPPNARCTNVRSPRS